MNFLPEGTFSPGPLSLEEISATQVKVPCTTQVLIKGFGFLDPSLGSADLPEGTELELPLWLVHALSKRSYVKPKVPSRFRETYRDILKADPSVVDLNRLGPHFYQTALHVAALPTNHSEELAYLLPEVFKARLIKMADLYGSSKGLKSAHGDGEEKALIKETHMDVLEKSLYESSRQGAQLVTNYFLRK